jgi:predicted nucleotidyltransferase
MFKVLYFQVLILHVMNNDVLNILRQNKALLFSKYPLQSMALFGSQSRGDAKDTSDVDILVEINGTMGFEFLHLNYEIEDLLKRKVDIISRRGLKPQFIQQIEPELVYV